MPTIRHLHVNAELPLRDEPETGHNRWHPDIPPALSCDPGEEVVLATRDAFDGQMNPGASLDDVRAPNLNVVHPLTGPVAVNGAEPGDLLEVEILDVESDTYGFTVQVPGFGFLRDSFPEPFIVKWTLKDNWAESPDLPGVRIPGAPFMGTIGVAPDRRLMEETTRRERSALERGGFVLPPEPADSVPWDPKIASEALRTIPPRETAGNVDIKQLTRGTKLYIPTYVPGALFSAGDAHFAQGDGEVCGTAIEMRASLHVRFRLHKGVAHSRGLTDLQFDGDSAMSVAASTVSTKFHATTGISVTRDGENRAEDLTLAARNAVLNMIDYLHGCGWTAQEAYALCSVAVDLKVSELVDVPNYVVAAVLPLGIFADGSPNKP